MHEFLHVLGAMHEQSRLDRDQYVQIHWDNIIEDKMDQACILSCILIQDITFNI